jgi:hypothetical protein
MQPAQKLDFFKDDALLLKPAETDPPLLAIVVGFSAG